MKFIKRLICCFFGHQWKIKDDGVTITWRCKRCGKEAPT